MDAPPALRTLRLVVEYDGTDFAGWQRQDGQRTVQGCLEQAFAKMAAEPVLVRGAGRTHAPTGSSSATAIAASAVTCA